MPAERDWHAIAERLVGEERLSASEAARIAGGEKFRPQQIARWITIGKRGVYLDGILAAGQSWWTSKEALIRFFADLSELAARRIQRDVQAPSPTARQRRAAAAVVKLEALRMGSKKKKES